MTSYLIRRLLLMIPTLIGCTAIVFFTIALSPGGIGASILNKDIQLRPEERRAREEYMKARYNLGAPLPEQYLHWLKKVLPIGFKPRGTGYPESIPFGFKPPDLGMSFTRDRPVVELIKEAVPITLLLELVSLPVTYLIAIYTGILAARKRGTFADVGVGSALLGLYSLPTIWVGVLLIGFLTNSQYLHLFPTNGLHDTLAESWAFLPHFTSHGFQRGWLLDTVWHLVLPVFCLSYGSFAFISRLTRGSLLETLNQDFVRTARAKGLPERIVVYRHAFRNSLISQITVAAGILPGLISGSVIVETIFGVPGMGKLMIDAVNSRDKELFLSLTLIGGLLQLVGFLLADLAYAVADPRVSYVD